MSKHLQQSTAVITLFWSGNLFQGRRNPLALSRRVPKPGDFLRGVSHCSQLFGLDPKDVAGEWLRRCVYKSGLYRTSSTMALLQGKSYNSRIRGHKLIMEKLLHLKWDAFWSWVSKGGGERVERKGVSILNLVYSVMALYRTATPILLLCNTAIRVDAV